MGNIEDSIYKNYRKAIEEGRLDQAKKSIEIARYLREKIELESFIDYSLELSTKTFIIENTFEPIPYRYYPDQGIVVIKKSAINLTSGENRLFYLFSANESSFDNTNIISRSELKKYMWGDNATKQAVRLAVKRLRDKIEPDKNNPQMIISVYNKGYIFIGKRISDTE